MNLMFWFPNFNIEGGKKHQSLINALVTASIQNFDLWLTHNGNKKVSLSMTVWVSVCLYVLCNLVLAQVQRVFFSKAKTSSNIDLGCLSVFLRRQNNNIIITKGFWVHIYLIYYYYIIRYYNIWLFVLLNSLWLKHSIKAYKVV